MNVDLSPPEHEHSAIVDHAIEWYAANYQTIERPIVPALRQRFGLTSHQAVVCIREVTLRRARAA
ncbi:hypothetical protein X727_23065 [Mesorhizobium sp. L103C119B0]|uniref:hypothetical protein n=1 Tax=Mesorhizobium sp. L103C119B0 TaxID=1287085 RepID=UPI0003D06D80|nr:hypothetical protein [Mesorhizobium sp. L103C119B0]ESZ68095.1 hypothetical protein X727_23065 [Mesorhizobium sp. L103C119B0]